MSDLERVVARLAQEVERRFYGKYRGFVVDNEDPEMLGRLRVSVPSVLGDKVVTGWAVPCVPYGGAAGLGMLFVPAVEAGVWVEFEEGDLEFPIWVGTFWSKPGGDTELPRPNGPDGAEQDAAQSPPTRKILKTAKGHTLQFEDADDQEMVILREATHGHVLTMDKDGVTVTDESGNVIRMTADGITLTDAAENVVAMTEDGITLTDAADNVVAMTGDGITLTDAAGNSLQMKQDAFNLVAKTPFTLDASGQPIVLKGSTIDLNKG